LGSTEGTYARAYLKTTLERVAQHTPDDSPVGIVVSDTMSFRNLDKVVLPTDLVVEIGCSYGAATERLVKRVDDPGQVLAVDTGRDCILRVKERLGGVRAIQCDVLRFYADLFVNLVAMKSAYGPESKVVVFCDIGGDRELESVVALLPFLALTIRPVTVVVKSEMLAHGAYSLGALNDPEWLELCQVSTQSLEQRKLQLSTNKVPKRFNPSGTPICMFHQFNSSEDGSHEGCQKSGKCAFDHAFCYACGASTDHLAIACSSPVREADLHSLFLDSYASLDLPALLQSFPARFCEQPALQQPCSPHSSPAS
jgi:hypothetical protein